MKKIIALLLLLSMMMSLVACGGSTEKEADENADDRSLYSDYDYSSNTIEKGAEYSFGLDEWDMYVATAISDKLVRVVNWNKDSSDKPSFEEEDEIGVFRIDDPTTGFIWIDDEHTAFYMNVQDDNKSKLKNGRAVPFSLLTSDGNRNKGANYDDDEVSYSYEYDSLYSYRAIPLSSTTIKIEAWRCHSGLLWDKIIYAYDVLVINTEKTNTDFEWTDDEHTSFALSMMDPENGNYWNEKKLVYFIVDNEALLPQQTDPTDTARPDDATDIPTETATPPATEATTVPTTEPIIEPTTEPTTAPTTEPTSEPTEDDVIRDIVLPISSSKLGKDLDYKSSRTACYINVDGVSNKPKLENWGGAIVVDGVADYLEYLESLGFTVQIINTETKEPYSGFHTYETNIKVSNEYVSWTMYLFIQDEKYVEYQFDINLE